MDEMEWTLQEETSQTSDVPWEGWQQDTDMQMPDEDQMGDMDASERPAEEDGMAEPVEQANEPDVPDLEQQYQQRMDEFVAGLGWVNEFTGEDIATREQYDRYLQMRDAASRGEDPVAAVEISNMREQLAEYQLRDQDAQLSSDPQLGETYGLLRDQVLELVDYCRRQGQREVDVEAAFQVLLRHNFGTLLEQERQRTEQAAIRKVQANRQASPGMLHTNGGAAPTGFASMGETEFQKQVELALQGALLGGPPTSA